jgi:beta-fructofuranosidase
MQSEMLRKAREYEAEKREQARNALPVYHVTGGIGWINDPNGFSVYQGEYHLFFQYYPYDVTWGPMHWGHVKTKDFVRWEFLPAALAPDAPYDKDGCFSGSAVESPDGRQILLYTGVRKTETGDEFQTQCVAVGDGADYEKTAQNPVIDASMLPPGGSHVDFRDPKLWREGEGYRAVAANLLPGNGTAGTDEVGRDQGSILILPGFHGDKDLTVRPFLCHELKNPVHRSTDRDRIPAKV